MLTVWELLTKLFQSFFGQMNLISWSPQEYYMNMYSIPNWISMALISECQLGHIQYSWLTLSFLQLLENVVQLLPYTLCVVLRRLVFVSYWLSLLGGTVHFFPTFKV